MPFWDQIGRAGLCGIVSRNAFCVDSVEIPPGKGLHLVYRRMLVPALWGFVFP